MEVEVDKYEREASLFAHLPRSPLPALPHKGERKIFFREIPSAHSIIAHSNSHLAPITL